MAVAKKQYPWKTKTTGVTPIAHRYATLRFRAKARGLEMSISQEMYEDLAFKPCTYCGGPLGKRGHGLDRIDNRLGYVPGNVTPCCGDCNETKGHLEGAGFHYPRTIELMRELFPLGNF
jgi:hypothetical protein